MKKEELCELVAGKALQLGPTVRFGGRRPYQARWYFFCPVCQKHCLYPEDLYTHESYRDLCLLHLRRHTSGDLREYLMQKWLVEPEVSDAWIPF